MYVCSVLFLFFQVVENCKDVGEADGKYFYYAADMSDLTSTQKVIQV